MHPFGCERFGNAATDARASTSNECGFIGDL
jgi:hypothetical protein